MALYNIVIDPLHYVLGQTAGISQALATFATTARAAGGAGMSMGNNGGTIAILSNIKDGLINLDGLKNFAYYSNGDSIVESLEGILNSIPNFSIGSINFGLNPSFEHFDVLLLVPVLTFVTYFLTSKINRKLSYQSTASEGADSRQVACSNTMMDVSMPMMSTFFTFMVPALIGVYWMFRSLIGMLKQYIIAKMMPLPTFTEEDYKQAEREYNKGKEVKKKAASEEKKAKPKVKSLHHIDDDDEDYPDLPPMTEGPRKTQENEKKNKKSSKKEDKKDSN
jgi:membrane protein insertase Oxa1/YidC/SpoIIIJ